MCRWSGAMRPSVRQSQAQQSTVVGLAPGSVAYLGGSFRTSRLGDGHGQNSLDKKTLFPMTTDGRDALVKKLEFDLAMLEKTRSEGKQVGAQRAEVEMAVDYGAACDFIDMLLKDPDNSLPKLVELFGGERGAEALARLQGVCTRVTLKKNDQNRVGLMNKIQAAKRPLELRTEKEDVLKAAMESEPLVQSSELLFQEEEEPDELFDDFVEETAEIVVNDFVRVVADGRIGKIEEDNGRTYPALVIVENGFPEMITKKDLEKIQEKEKRVIGRKRWSLMEGRLQQREKQEAAAIKFKGAVRAVIFANMNPQEVNIGPMEIDEPAEPEAAEPEEPESHADAVADNLAHGAAFGALATVQQNRGDYQEAADSYRKAAARLRKTTEAIIKFKDAGRTGRQRSMSGNVQKRESMRDHAALLRDASKLSAMARQTEDHAVHLESLRPGERAQAAEEAIPAAGTLVFQDDGRVVNKFGEIAATWNRVGVLFAESSFGWALVAPAEQCKFLMLSMKDVARWDTWGLILEDIVHGVLEGVKWVENCLQAAMSQDRQAGGKAQCAPVVATSDA